MIEFSGVLIAISALSLTVTKVVDFLRNAFDKNETLPKWVISLVALVVGLAFALGWQLNLAASIVALVPALAEHASSLDGVSGQLLTGLAIGAGAGFWHELLDALSSIASKNDAIASQ